MAGRVSYFSAEIGLGTDIKLWVDLTIGKEVVLGRVVEAEGCERETYGRILAQRCEVGLITRCEFSPLFIDSAASRLWRPEFFAGAFEQKWRASGLDC